MASSPLITKLIEALRCLPGVGPKSAQRIAFELLQRKRQEAIDLANKLNQAMELVGSCSKCCTLSEQEICQICSDLKRNNNILCIVETPSDVIAIEQTVSYNGHYFVLMGHLSPLDGIGPKEIGIPKLMLRIQELNTTEIIIA